MFHVKSSEALVGGQLERIGNEAGSVASGGLVQRVAVVQRLRKGVNAAEKKALAEALAQFRLQGVVGTVAAREPGPSVGNARVGAWRLRWNVEGSRWDRRSCERRTDSKANRGIVGWGGRIRRIVVGDGLARIKCRINGGAGEGRANQGGGGNGVEAAEGVGALG